LRLARALYLLVVMSCVYKISEGTILTCSYELRV
jgi:hypothetical protein